MLFGPIRILVFLCMAGNAHMHYTVILYSIWDTEGQLFDCSKLPYEIAVLLPDLLKKKEEIDSFCKYVNKKTFSVLQF